MVEALPHLLNNVLFIIIPVLFYLLFLNEEDSARQKHIFSKFSIFLVISLLLTMIFPAEYSDAFLYDLRIVPILMAILYGSRLSGLSLILVMLFYTFLFQYSEFFVYLGNYTVAFILLWWIKPRYVQADRFKRFIIVTLFYLSIVITRGLFLIHIGQVQQLPLLVILSLITWFTIVAVQLLIENMDKQTRLKRELQHNEKVDAVSQLAASVTHEVKNPLTTVKGFLQILHEKDYISDKDQSYLRLSIDELERAEFIIRNYLSLSKPEKNPYGIVDISSVLQNLIKLLATYQQDIQLVTAVEPDLTVKGIKYEIQQVLLNIIKNGMEAMSDHPGQLYIKAMRRDSDVVITIKDQGKGMAKNDLKRIGQPYFTTKENGTGLGMSVSFEIVKRMGGRITVHSELGYGTIFTIELPLTSLSFS
ncbi:sporulation kinase [Virgibacillus sp. MSP4-1]|uniref:ATP-binding protein n=1 Tax=Virgibacillus sp. MSP4-1 TaxID=2700081 RepID=UPI00039D33B1|nr:ATP-binding protein [Virgibacillus sp. MSP4-1]QHS22509.1 sporulation kinase [Virgibacillus sp. MSP4-1]